MADCLALPALIDAPIEAEELDVYHSVARMHLPEGCGAAFSEGGEDGAAGSGADFLFPARFDDWNFQELPENTLLGRRLNLNAEIRVMDDEGRDVAEEFLHYRGAEIRLRRPVVPSMFSKDLQVITQDCLGYLMQRYTLS